MIARLLKSPAAKEEGKRLVRFFLVGGTSFTIHFLGYFFLSRAAFPGADRTLLNFAAICVSVTFNFLAHRGWTYGSSEKGLGQIARYFAVISAAGLLQLGLFYVGFELLGFYDLFVTIVVAGLSATFSFLAHRFFTFRPKNGDGVV